MAAAPDFVCIDFETANPDLASVCQVGVAVFANGVATETWTSLVDPRAYFDPWNVRVHGIEARAVVGAPSFGDIAAEIDRRLAGRIAVCHTHFDRSALALACTRLGTRPPDCEWLDSARVVRRTWSEFARKGYGLENVCAYLGLSFRHHDALEDARAAGAIILRAMAETGLDVHGLLVRSLARTDHGFATEGDPAGLFAGETVAFTGALSLPRREAARLAASAGFTVAAGVTQATTVLVVGDQDARKLAGHEKSSKHRKAEEFRAGGQLLRIIGESDFRAMLIEANCR